MRKTIFTQLVAVFFIVLFVYAAVSGVAEYAVFYRQLPHLPMLIPLAGWVSWLVPALEMVIAAMLFTRRWRLAGLVASFSLMLLFTWYTVIIVTLHEPIYCSFGRVPAALSWNQHLIFNCITVVLASAAILLYQPVMPLVSLMPDYEKEYHTSTI